MLNKRTIALLLAAALLLPLASCAKTENDPAQSAPPSDTAPAATEPAATEPAETEPPRLPSNLPDLDLEGAVITILRSGNTFTEIGVGTRETNGQNVNDAIYNRNVYLEDKYNCSIEVVDSESQHPAVSDIPQYVLANDDTVDILLDGGEYIANRTENYTDLKSFAYLDFDQPWWNKEFNEGISLAGKLYFTVGAYSIAAKQRIFHVIFEKQVAIDNNIDPEALYTYAREGTWTLDKMTEYAQMVKADLNGDGKYDTEDRWGVLGQNYNTWSLALGAGFRCADKDENDIPYLTFDTEENLNILAKVHALAGNREITQFAQEMVRVADCWTKLVELGYASGYWLFEFGALNGMMREMEDDYGVLPMPKYDENQRRYYHDASLGNNPVAAIPISASEGGATASFPSSTTTI